VGAMDNLPTYKHDIQALRFVPVDELKDRLNEIASVWDVRVTNDLTLHYNTLIYNAIEEELLRRAEFKEN